MARALILGVVESYDGERGLGTVRSDTGDSYAFHSTAIADGSRQIDPGTSVAFVTLAGLGGVREAGDLTPVGVPFARP